MRCLIGMIAGVTICLTAGAYQANDAVGSGSVRQVHDPCLIRSGDIYYLYSTGIRDRGIESRRSRDLIHWEKQEAVFPEAFPEWMAEAVPGIRNLWAPDISFHNGEYRLYYSGSRFGKNTSFIALATNRTLDPADPAYQWQDKGIVIRSEANDNFNAIDPNIIADEKGDLWIVYGSFWTGIYLTPLDSETGKPRESPPQRHRLAYVPKPPHDVEAPFIVRKNGYYTLFVSFGFCARGVNSTYHIAVGRSRSILGPYMDQSDKSLLEGGGTILLESRAPVHGPGHNAVLLGDDGKDWLVHHFYDGRRRGTPTLQVRPLTWSDDGWPLVGEAIGESE